MTFDFAPPPSAEPDSHLGRVLVPTEWADAGIPLLRNPREVVIGLHARHLPSPWTAVVAVFGPDERLVASASFAREGIAVDGWDTRNALLGQLRQVIPHDLRRRTPVRTAVLLHCREGSSGWTEEDGAWMWGLRDACTLHGLRCGAYITLTRGGWQVLGEGRSGRKPHSGSTPGWAVAASGGIPEQGAPGPVPRAGGGVPKALGHTAAR
ncbi:hypothetical protein [Streptomyces palmae]|uniref:Uncharacterized protein n=1 Tax=Streptomyces palmae TaxID=1701085 RepID=A0A4Z0HDR9_9ACTN|nr:hypothetical protein [Streptomyces palmae]TGB16916.1 hypothetical protein E4099_04495 [Streptomyces palmae]